MTVVAIPQQGLFPLETAQWVRNGKFPDALIAQAMAEGVNHAGAYRLKEVARFATPMDDVPIHDGTRDRWRFAFHSSPFARSIVVQMVLAPRVEGVDSPSGLLTISDGGSTLGTASVYGGFTSGTVGDTPAWCSIGRSFLQDGGAIATIPPETDLYGVFADINDARLIAASAWELALDPDTTNGYLSQAFTAGAPILDTHRQNLTTAARSMWTRGSAHVWNWSVDRQTVPRTFAAGAGARNVIDTSLSAVSTKSPGAAIPLTFRTRVSGSGVPLRLAVYASRGSANGTITLRNAAGTTIATVTITGSAAWYTTDFEAPAASDGKLDLFASSAGGTLSVYAASLFRYAA